MRTERGLERILFFSDAVVAIAITLLVLPLLELRSDAHDGGVAHLLRAHDAELLAFGLSFVVIGVLWVAQHRVMEVVDTYDSTMLRLQLAWLATVAFLPFPTQLLGATDGDRGAYGLYIGTLLVSSLLLSGLAVHIDRTPAIRVADAPSDSRGGAWLTTALFGVAFVLAVATSLGMWSMLAMLLDGPIGWLLARRRRRAMQSAPRR
ncbi:MAG: TMEM175 family protein [Acidimicrobiales bacterium]